MAYDCNGELTEYYGKKLDKPKRWPAYLFIGSVYIYMVLGVLQRYFGH